MKYMGPVGVFALSRPGKGKEYTIEYSFGSPESERIRTPRPYFSTKVDSKFQVRDCRIESKHGVLKKRAKTHTYAQSRAHTNPIVVISSPFVQLKLLFRILFQRRRLGIPTQFPALRYGRLPWNFSVADWVHSVTRTSPMVSPQLASIVSQFRSRCWIFFLPIFGLFEHLHVNFSNLEWFSLFTF